MVETKSKRSTYDSGIPQRHPNRVGKATGQSGVGVEKDDDVSSRPNRSDGELSCAPRRGRHDLCTGGLGALPPTANTAIWP